MKPIKNFKEFRKSKTPIYQYNKSNKEFIRVYFVSNDNGKEIKLGFNEYFIFAGENYNFNFERLSYRYMDSKTFKSDFGKYVYYANK